MQLLIVETSGRAGQVALARDAALVRSRRLDEARRHARDLAPAVAELLAAEGWKPRDVNAVIVSRGPGSYTGLRVGIMAAKTFAYATGCTLLAVDTFAAIARQAPSEADRLEVLADAQQDKIYVQRFIRSESGSSPQAASALAIQPFAEWQAARESEAWITGPGLRGLRARLTPGCLVVDAVAWDPQSESLLLLGLERYQAGLRDDPWSLEPLYLRPSSAEEKWRSSS